mmetsp:Transcript_43459/g.48934  ORF Transcript_43459/g.48934 Transcript_43459/m.48934 type:complete len:1821 (+) Transcript_43459:59-5521(+)
MNEIPLVYPNNHTDATRRYVVDSSAKRPQISHVSTISNSTVDSNGNAKSASILSPSTYLQPLDEAMQGAASASTVKLRGQELLVTTSALVENPNIISVALSWKKHEEDALESPTMIELDVKDLRVVSIRAFAVVTDDDDFSSHLSDNNKMILVLVGCQGTIVSISLDENLIADTQAPLKILNRENYIPVSLLEQVGGSDLRGNMISFFPTKNHMIVMALSPLIVTIDWKDTGKSAVWSETECLEEMATRASSFSGMITSLPSLIFGNKMDADVVDIPPTAALCVSTNKVKFDHAEDEDPSAVLVFTLHSDASIRKWRVDPESSLVPLEVSTLECDKLSLPSTWSDGRKSVSLCARVYEQTFVLAVHIKTNILSSYNKGVSDCNIWVFEGPDKLQSTQECRIMKVPHDAVSLVGMSFVTSERRCILSAVFDSIKISDGESNKEYVSSGIKIINYPPSLLSMVSSEPDVVETMSLDKIATTERDRIRSLPYGSIVLMELEKEDEENEEHTTEVTVDQALHKLDSLYMKHLFRPIFPRGNGTVLPPSGTCIRRAMSKLVHGAIKEHGMSVELELIKTLYEWRNRDKRKVQIGSPSKMSRSMIQDSKTSSKPALIEDSGGLSVYESFVGLDEGVEQVDMIIQDEYDEFEQFEEELISEIESHENRWQRLLYQIWEEEQMLRSPLCVSWLESLPVQILVRGNLTTALTIDGRINTNDETSWKITLQEASSNILDLIEADHDKIKTLYEIEEQLTFIVSQAQLAISPQTSITEGLTSLGRWARLQGNNNSDDGKLRKLINQVPIKDLVSWIEDKPIDIRIFTTEPGHTQIDKGNKSSSQQVAKSQLRHASCSCAIRATDFIRRSRLSKCLLLLELAAGSRATFAAFRAYVQTIAILWTSAQRIKMPNIAFQKQLTEQPVVRKIRFENDSSPRNRSPPSKRSSCGDITSSIFASLSSTISTTSTLDVVMIKISQDVASSFNAASSPFSAISTLSGSYVNLIFSRNKGTKGGTCPLLPELSVLPKSKDDERPNDHLDLSLRLLAPFVAFQIPDDAPEFVVARKEQLSLCLLHAAHSKSFSPRRKSLMREMACDLLVPKNQDENNPVEKDYTKKGLDVLKSIGTNLIFSVVADDRLNELMHTMIPNATSIELMRVCRMSTTRNLFSPYAMATETNLDDVTYSHTVQIAKLMLHLSRIFHRLNILESYITRSEDGEYGDDYNSDSLLQIISDAIADMENIFPEEFLRKMPEYISIWTKKFDHAIRASRWSQAYNACVKNPLGEHRESNFKRLVRAMVDSGALNELLDMCTQLGMGSSTPVAATDDDYKESESIDLYEIAADVLLSYADSDVYDSRATSSFNTNLSDYQGALYALHASQEQWRRATQSLDLRYVNAEKALLRSTGRAGVGINIQTSELRDGLIIQDMVSSASGSANAIQLVKDPDYRFIVSGEYSPYSKIYFGDDDLIEETPNKLKRGRERNEINNTTKEDEVTVDRLSKFMVGDHLDARAIRATVLRTLFFDRSASFAFAKSAFRRGLDTAKVDIEELFKNGYYQYGLLLAKAWIKTFYNGKTKPAGEDKFGSYLYLLMRKYLVPLASSTDDEDEQRPTLQQLQTAIDALGSSGNAASYIVTGRSVKLAGLEKAAVKAATFTLIQKLTINHSTAETTLAVDIAASFLDLGKNNTQIPVWLERLLLGADSTTGGAGAFAPRPKTDCKDYLGNSSALLTLYISRGMFSEACNVVTTILGNNHRASKAASRLPEKGNIDYVPYHSIDLLWNMIDIACSKGVYNNAEQSRILKTRNDMEKALQKHVEISEISEMGMRSARMLNA